MRAKKIVSKFFIFICIFLFYDVSLQAHQARQIVVNSAPEHDNTTEYRERLKAFLPDPILISSITYHADVYMQKDELDYLVGIKEGSLATAADLAHAVFFLSKKSKFDTIGFTITPHAVGWDLHIEMKAFWTFNKLKFKGIFVGKEHLRQFYLMEHHDRFDMQRHADSIAKMQESFKRDGYFQAKIEDSFCYDERTKSVTVKIALNKGSRFATGKIRLKVASSLVSPERQRQLCRVLRKQLAGRLAKNYYTRDLVNAITKSLKKTLAAKGYVHSDIELDERVHYKERRVDFIFNVTVYQKKKLCFQGNVFFSHEQLLNCLLAFGRSVSLLPGSILSEELIKLYHDSGFWSAHIAVEEMEDRCLFSITEHERISIVGIEIRNLESCDEHFLIKKFFTPLLKKKFYDKVVLDDCIDQCMAHLVRQGFWQSTLLHQTVEQVGIDEYTIVLTIDEGEQHFLKKVCIPDFVALQSQGPFGQFTAERKPMPFDINMVEEQRQWLLNYFQKKGYYQVLVQPLFDRQGNDVSIRWDVHLQEQCEGQTKTVVVGSSTFPFSFIKRELDYKVGDRWHKDTIRYAISRLKKLEIFEAVTLLPEKRMSDDPASVMVLKLQKDDPYEVKMRTGLGIQHMTKSLSIDGLTYRLGGSFLYKNPTNTGDQFRIDADFTRSIRLANAQYLKPWLFGLPVSALFQGYSNKFDYPGFIGSQRNLYTVIQQGFLMNFNTVYNMFDAALSTGVEVVDTFIDESTPEQASFAQDVARAINFRPDLLDKNIPFFLVQPTLIIYYLDSTVNPTKGSFSVLSVKGMFPLAKLEPNNFFIRILAEQSFFVPLWPFVFALRVRVGHIFHPKFCTILPIERFYLGGANSIRSYETDQCPPLGVVTDPCKDKCLFVPQGGRSLANLNLEMRFPIYQQFGGVLFGDIGALSTNRLTDIKAQDLLGGVGFGLRYNTPIGPLRFDFAWRVHKRDGVGRPYAWFLSFGNAFI